MEQSGIIHKAEAFVARTFNEKVPEEFAYHNFNHTQRVVKALDKLHQKSDLSEDSREILILAGYFHDVGFSIDPDKHETFSKNLAEEFLNENDYPQSKIDLVLECIDATRMDWKGDGKLCLMMKDADLSGLADPEYESISEGLRKEMSYRENKTIDSEKWIEENIQFLENHNYLSEEGKALFDSGKKINLKKLKKKKKKNKQKNVPDVTIANNKSAQTQFKTALRNHIDLSSIADNKANIMLSVNAVIITVGLPLLVDRAMTNSSLIAPTVILAIVSTISMIFATLSTRPIQMSGLTALDDIKKKKTNLFFFGNYYKMNIDSYEKAVEEVLADSEILDNSIIRDLFYLGKSLGKKFEYLRWCYNFFMYGIVAAILSYFVTHLLSHL